MRTPAAPAVGCRIGSGAYRCRSTKTPRRGALHVPTCRQADDMSARLLADWRQRFRRRAADALPLLGAVRNGIREVDAGVDARASVVFGGLREAAEVAGHVGQR